MAADASIPAFTIFHILADLCHAASVLILLWAFCYRKSAEGVSLLTQILYVIVFVTRYLDLALTFTFSSYLFYFKIFFLFTSILTVFLMLRVFTRTREREAAWKLTIWSLIACLVTSPIVYSIFKDWKELGATACSRTSFSCVLYVVSDIMRTFSIELESVCVLPQLLLLRLTSVPTVLDTKYLLALGSYRALYIANWIVTGARGDHVDPVSVIFGIIQTALYVDFAWVYYSRQRVKLRRGGVVDSDDLSKSLLIRRIIGRKAQSNASDADEDGDLEDQENGVVSPAPQRHWGVEGISISADDTLAEHDLRGPAEISHPDQFRDDEDDSDEAPAPPAKDDHVEARHGDTLHSSANAWLGG